MYQPIQVSSEMVLNEYHSQLAAMTAETIRQRCIIAMLEIDRNRAWSRVEELEAQIARTNEAETFRSGRETWLQEPAG